MCGLAAWAEADPTVSPFVSIEFSPRAGQLLNPCLLASQPWESGAQNLHWDPEPQSVYVAATLRCAGLVNQAPCRHTILERSAPQNPDVLSTITEADSGCTSVTAPASPKTCGSGDILVHVYVRIRRFTGHVALPCPLVLHDPRTKRTVLNLFRANLAIHLPIMRVSRRSRRTFAPNAQREQR